VPAPYLRVDTNDYSLDPALVGCRVEVIVEQRTVTAIALDTGELACQPARVFAPTAPSPRSSTRAPWAPAVGRRRHQSTCGRWPATTLDRMNRATSELAHLPRQLKAPPAARALPKLADRARAEEWSV
jgi:hypothetical protein